MKSPNQSFLNLQQKLKVGSIPLRLTSVSRLFTSIAAFLPDLPLWNGDSLLSNLVRWFDQLKSLGATAGMEDYERRKLRVFNLLNFFQLVFGIIIPITAMITRPKISTLGWVAACMPALVSVLVLYLNSRRQNEVSILCYFILYPVITSIVYLSGMNLGIELFFILYGILAVFFIQDIGHMAFTVTLSMISYFILTVVWRNYQFQLEVNGVLFLLNHLVAIIFIFFALFLVKKENANYQANILQSNRMLREKNMEIELQQKEIAENVELLNKQAAELQELNALKNKLFSVIAHDLKAPIYALRTIFVNVQKYDTPAQEVKEMVPEVMKDLNYTTSLMENLLQWAKCQMHSLEVTLERTDLSNLAADVVQLLDTQAVSKNVNLVNTIDAPAFVMAQQEMIRLVLRNLLSNAIKFTPEEGYVIIGIEDLPDSIEVYVTDTGIGITQDNIRKIHQNDYFSTNGTASEKGTGLGLMLCKEFLGKNNASLLIESDPPNGSRFSFLLKKA